MFEDIYNFFEKIYNFIMLKRSKKGFTFSETLITALVIGVVATLTIPVIIGNYDSI